MPAKGANHRSSTNATAPQPQPVVRVHPVSGRKALYLCEREQMDWINGPFAGMEPGVKGEAARLLYRLMHHFTQPALTYAHHWDQGDLVVYDNRCTDPLGHLVRCHEIQPRHVAHHRVGQPRTVLRWRGAELGGRRR